MKTAPIHILLVEDNPGDARLVVEMLREATGDEFVLTLVDTVALAVAHLHAGTTTHAVLLDLSLPDESGLETVRRVMTVAGRAIVVVMTGADDEELGIAAVREGAQDYLVKGSVDGASLRRRLKFAIQRHGKLETLALKDDLTGLHNRRGFLALAEQQLKVARRNGDGALLLFIDLDGMKMINDSFGHAEGNRALIDTACLLSTSFRASDVVGRLGGDEFVALMIGADETIQTAVRQRIDDALLSLNSRPDRAYPLDFSVGMMLCRPDERESIEQLIERADALMYEEKRRRRAGRTVSA
jgi:diguanylate cyclase (GGDEF)-like protein